MDFRWLMGLFFYLLTCSAWGVARITNGEFKVSSLGQTALDSKAVKSGLETLFYNTPACKNPAVLNCISAAEIQSKADQIEIFFRGMTNKVNKADQEIPFVEKHSVDAVVAKIEFSFPSLIQRAGEDKNNMVHGIYMFPLHGKLGLKKFPTLVIFHSSTDLIAKNELDLAKWLVTLSQDTAVMLVYFPHFGPRRNLPGAPNEDINEDFYADDTNTFIENVEQSVLDHHLAFDWLRLQNTTNQKKISALGLSLGTFTQNIFEAVDPDRVTHGHILVGSGTDIALIAKRYFSFYPDDSFTKKKLAAGWGNEEALRKKLYLLDPLAWVGQIKEQKYTALVMERDELMNFDDSVTPMLNLIKETNEVKIKWVDSVHNPSNATFFKKFTQVFLPILNFILH